MGRRNIAKAIAEMEKMTAGQLRGKYAQLFGEESRSGNRRWLFRRCAWRLQAQAEGGLSHRARRRAKELARDEDIRVRPPAEMDMPAAIRPADVRVSTRGRIRRNLDARLPAPGTELTRVYKGHPYTCKVLDNGFEYDGEVYRSLSAVAFEISGAHWNGFLFFNLTDPRKEAE